MVSFACNLASLLTAYTSTTTESIIAGVSAAVWWHCRRYGSQVMLYEQHVGSNIFRGSRGRSYPFSSKM